MGHVHAFKGEIQIHQPEFYRHAELSVFCKGSMLYFCEEFSAERTNGWKHNVYVQYVVILYFIFLFIALNLLIWRRNDGKIWRFVGRFSFRNSRTFLDPIFASQELSGFWCQLESYRGGVGGSFLKKHISHPATFFWILIELLTKLHWIINRLFLFKLILNIWLSHTNGTPLLKLISAIA